MSNISRRSLQKSGGKQEKEALTQALEDTLNQLEHLRLSEDAIETDEDCELGQGGFADVWAGELRRGANEVTEVAVKKLRSMGSWKHNLHTSIALAREMRVWANLDHPNILRLIGFYLDPKQHTAWIVTPLMVNGNVSRYFEEKRPDLAKRLEIIIDVTKALVYLHGRDDPVCHGDLKPDNILINSKGKAVLSDFGCAVIPGASPSGLTTGSFKGTTRYMAPELFDDESPKRSLKSDVWAWGCLVAELLTDKAPYSSLKAELKVIGEIVAATGPPKFLHQVQDFPVPLLQWACDRNPEERPEIKQCLEILQPTPEHAGFRIPNTGKPSREFSMSMVGYPNAHPQLQEDPDLETCWSVHPLTDGARYVSCAVDGESMAALNTKDKVVHWLNFVTGDYKKQDIPYSPLTGEVYLALVICRARLWPAGLGFGR